MITINTNLTRFLSKISVKVLNIMRKNPIPTILLIVFLVPLLLFFTAQWKPPYQDMAYEIIALFYFLSLVLNIFLFLYINELPPALTEETKALQKKLSKEIRIRIARTDEIAEHMVDEEQKLKRIFLKKRIDKTIQESINKIADLILATNLLQKENFQLLHQLTVDTANVK